MQVADIAGAATVATLGAKQTMAFGMVEDASFLMMLSANLYSNQNLACIRETLCNAWDAHIEAGRTDVPVKVTITKDLELIIEDSGNGIPDELMGQIYGTYGASTKRTNTAVTGGFGLGCKSPFAYTESFRVTSENQGKKVVYNMSRASVEVDGKPSISKVLEVPTTRDGLTVQFQLRQSDVREMTEYVKSVACNGDMLVHLKDEFFHDEDDLDNQGIIKTIGMSHEPGNYDVNQDLWYKTHMGGGSIFIRYGAVIYPMLKTPGTEACIALLKEFMDLVGFRRIVIQAAPGTLALTPSREALSSQKMTEDGLVDLCVSLVQRMEQDIISKIPASIQNAIDSLKSGSDTYSTLFSTGRLPNHISPLTVQKYLHSSLGRNNMLKYNPVLRAAERAGFRKKHVFDNVAATRQYHKLRTVIQKKGNQSRYNSPMVQAFIKHNVIRPLGKLIFKNKDVLKLHKIGHLNGLDNKERWKGGVLVSGVHSDVPFEVLKQMIDKPTVFLTSRMRNLRNSMCLAPGIPYAQGTWIYKLDAKEPEKEKIVAAFESGGFRVIDLTLFHEWDHPAQEILDFKEQAKAKKAAQKTGVTASVKPKTKKGMLISLSKVFNADGKKVIANHNLQHIKSCDKTSDTPLFYVPSTDIQSDGALGIFGWYQDLDDNERTHGVVVRDGRETNMAIKRGAVHVDSYFGPKFWAKINSPEYQEYMTKYRKEGLVTNHRITDGYVELCEKLGVKIPGLGKLIVNPEFERIHERLDHIHYGWLHRLQSTNTGAPELTVESFQKVRSFELQDMPCIKKLQALKADPIIRSINQGNDVLSLIDKYPDRKTALKSLVMAALKDGK